MAFECSYCRKIVLEGLTILDDKGKEVVISRFAFCSRDCRECWELKNEREWEEKKQAKLE